MIMENFIKKFERSVKLHWSSIALSDYEKSDITYGEMAVKIEKLHILWEEAGFVKGDRIAICSRSSSNWSVLFWAAVTGGYVPVELFNGFMPHDIASLTIHSGSRMLYTEKSIFDAMSSQDVSCMPAVADIDSFGILSSDRNLEMLSGDLEHLYMDCHPDGMSPDDVSYDDPSMDDLCSLMYTSGSTGNPKGVMITVRNFSWNVETIPGLFPYREGENYVSVLPFAHIFGLMCDCIVPQCLGMHTIILGRPPIPSNVSGIMQEYRPRIFLAVPLILSKFVEYAVGAEIRSEEGKEKLDHWKDNPGYCAMLRSKVLSALGGKIEAFATGGAAIPPEIESLLVFRIAMPFITGYGMTECAPLIAAGKIGSYKSRSCGEYVESLQVRIASPDPLHIPGEIQVKGDCVFKGYYNNPDATSAAFTDDGWFRTGDIGTVDADRTLFIAGRCKNMLLSGNGQNIFPEEIEAVLNGLPYVAESIVVQRGSALHAIIVPDRNVEGVEDMDAASLQNIMEGNRKKLNENIPAYSAVSTFEIMYEPFVKTPKGSIKRFLYS